VTRGRLPLLLAALAALVLAGVAAAKGPVQLCGASRCLTIGDERVPAIPLAITAGTKLHPPAAPAPYYVVRYARVGGVLGYWVPSANLVRLRVSERAVWVTPTRAQVARLTKVARAVAPKAPPRQFEAAEVGYERVEDPTGWLSLYTIGTPVASAPDAGGWTRIFAFTKVDTPWSDGTNKLSISRSGAYLRRDGELVGIPADVAEQIRARLPLE
jgi:ABC-type amino acid transport substrate-binding protein